MNGLIVDLFAGGGGASLGIERAIGRSPDIAINHSELAIRCHARNHPRTRHYTTDVWEVDPIEATGGRAVDLLWASPDCRHFSRAKGDKPVSKRVRSLAWVVTKWAKAVRPSVIAIENVAEFQTWGPLRDGVPIKERAGETFRRWVGQLRRLGYDVEWRTLNAADYGAPTTRKRLFLVARCDGQPIRWPRPTHGPNRSKPWRSAAECIDWSDLGSSIFGRSKPLAEATLRRIARGVVRFVLNSPRPFLVTCNHSGEHFRGQSIDEPMQTICAAHDARGIVAPVIAHLRGTSASHLKSCCESVQDPIGTISAQGMHHALASAYVVRNFGGMTGCDPRGPLPTVTAVDHHSLCAAPLSPLDAGTAVDRSREVAAFLVAYYGSEKDGQSPDAPLRVVPTRDRFGLVTVEIDGVPHVITDIRLRMLQPHELQRAQGFDDAYVIDGSKRDRVRLIGNSVCPPVAEAVIRSNTTGVGVIAAKEG